MTKVITAIGALFILLGATSAKADDALAAFNPFTGQLALRSAATAEMLSPRLIKPRLGVLDAARVGRRLVFEFGDDISYVGEVRSVVSRPGQCYTVTGSLGGHADGYFIITRQEEALAGIFQAPSDAFLAEMRFAGGGAHWLYKVDETRRPGCAGVVPLPSDESKAPHHGFPASVHVDSLEAAQDTSCPPSQYVHDYLVAYTGLSRAAAGGTNAIEAIVQTYVAWTSVAYANSGINLRLRLVHCAEVEYDEVVPPGTESTREVHLNRLISTSDGIMDEIHAWREAYNADAVMLLVSDHYGGLGRCCADEEHAFAMMHWNNGARQLAHEFGHNQGCDHNPENVGCGGCYSYSRAHVFTGDDAVEYGTIMSYVGLGIPHFSNPNVLYQGQPTGVADERDNARTIRERRAAVEDFKVTRFDIWVDFNAPGGPFQFGTPMYPYTLLGDGVNAVPPAECFSEMPNLWVEAGTTSEALTIDKPIVLNACGGTVRVGG